MLPARSGAPQNDLTRHQMGDLYRCTGVIRGLEAPEGEKTAILSGNAAAMFGL
ncbi:MAG: hypothetical protein HPY55_02680 [Firmicutes bacterium]|nr:hypothetical protein [Bacillota bacterium]